jgi:hypothetical protein
LVLNITAAAETMSRISAFAALLILVLVTISTADPNTAPPPLWTQDQLEEASRNVVGEADGEIAGIELRVSTMTREVEERIREARRKFDQEASDLVRREARMKQRLEEAQQSMRELLAGAEQRLANERAKWILPTATLGFVLCLVGGVALWAWIKTPPARRRGLPSYRSFV